MASSLVRPISSERGVIQFYEEKSPWGEFSNYYPSPLQINGKSYPTNEHFYQALKFLGPDQTPRSQEYAELIRQQNTPNKAKILANQKIKGGYAWVKPLNEIIRAYPDVNIRSDFDQVKDNLMRWGVFQKFLQHPQLFQVLDSTGSAQLAEHTPRDHYWADGGDGSGKNMLGRILMETRAVLRRTRIPSSQLGYEWLLEGVILTRTSSTEFSTDALNQLGVNCLVDLSGRDQLVQSILGVKSSEPIYLYQNDIIFLQRIEITQDQLAEVLIQAIGQGRVCYIDGSPEELTDFLPAVWRHLYHIPPEMADQLTREILL